MGNWRPPPRIRGPAMPNIAHRSIWESAMRMPTASISPLTEPLMQYVSRTRSAQRAKSPIPGEISKRRAREARKRASIRFIGISRTRKPSRPDLEELLHQRVRSSLQGDHRRRARSAPPPRSPPYGPASKNGSINPGHKKRRDPRRSRLSLVWCPRPFGTGTLVSSRKIRANCPAIGVNAFLEYLWGEQEGRSLQACKKNRTLSECLTRKVRGNFGIAL